MAPTTRTTTLLFLVTLVPAVASPPRAISQTTAADPSAWTVQKLARQVEQTIDRFDTVSLEAVYSQKRDVNAFVPNKKPLIVNGSGSILYRGDRERWFLKNDGYTFRIGAAELTPKTTISGNDGEVHYSGDSKRLTLAEKVSRRSGRPRSIIWETILTYPYLGRALERETSEIVFAGKADRRQVVDLESKWGTDERLWQVVVRFDTERSFLPLWQKMYYEGKLYAESSLEEIAPVEGTSDYYPAVINTKYHQKALGVIEQQYAISKFRLPKSFDEEAFRYEPPPGVDIIDRRSNLAWHSDPWWDELMPWTTRQLGFPRYKFQSLGDFRSTCDDSMEGKDAPPISASFWLGENPGGWDRDGRKFSILFFWGDASTLSQPFNKWVTELGQLARLVEPLGGEVIGIGSHRTSPDDFRRTAKELMISIPFAIDQADEGEGVTHTAYQLSHYFSVVVVDHQGKVRLLSNSDGDALMSTIGKILSKDEMEAIRSVLNIDPAMSRGEHDAIKAHWIQLRRKTPGQGKIHGRVGKKGATVKLLPQMKMLIGSNPGGYMLFQDHRGTMSVEADQATGQYEFLNLPRGVYQLSVELPDGKADKTTVVLRRDDASAQHSFFED